MIILLYTITNYSTITKKVPKRVTKYVPQYKKVSHSKVYLRI